MRISVDPNDPGYYVNAKEVVDKISVDGCEIQNVITVDERSGEVVMLTTDENGRFVMDGDKIAQHSIFGSVRIKFRRGLSFTDLAKLQ